LLAKGNLNENRAALQKMSGCEKAIEYYTGVKNLKKKVGSLTEESFKIARAYSSAGVALKIGEFCFASRDRLKACPPPPPIRTKAASPLGPAELFANCGNVTRW
jgi:hypothetical protein